MNIYILKSKLCFCVSHLRHGVQQQLAQLLINFLQYIKLYNSLKSHHTCIVKTKNHWIRHKITSGTGSNNSLPSFSCALSLVALQRTSGLVRQAAPRQTSDHMRSHAPLGETLILSGSEKRAFYNLSGTETGSSILQQG